MRTINRLVIHHSAGPSGNVQEFRKLHVNEHGWSDVAYHEVICNGKGGPDGHIQQGRPHAVKGAGVWGNNGGSVQVCLVGNFAPGTPGYSGMMTEQQAASLGWWLAKNATRYGIKDGRRVVGHKEITLPGHGTACPGDLPLPLIRQWFVLNSQQSDPSKWSPLDDYLRSKGVALKASKATV